MSGFFLGILAIVAGYLLLEKYVEYRMRERLQEQRMQHERMVDDLIIESERRLRQAEEDCRIQLDTISQQVFLKGEEFGFQRAEEKYLEDINRLKDLLRKLAREKDSLRTLLLTLEPRTRAPDEGLPVLTANEMELEPEAQLLNKDREPPEASEESLPAGKSRPFRITLYVTGMIVLVTFMSLMIQRSWQQRRLKRFRL